MGTFVITEGAHGRFIHTSRDPNRQFAHIFDPDSPEDVAHQAHNFATYASCLGSHASPVVLIGPTERGAYVEVQLSDWKSLVSTATRMPVVIR
jgi:hypothetical protein